MHTNEDLMERLKNINISALEVYEQIKWGMVDVELVKKHIQLTIFETTFVETL